MSKDNYLRGCKACGEQKVDWLSTSWYCKDCFELERQCRKEVMEYLFEKSSEEDDRAAQLHSRFGKFGWF